MSDTIPTIKVKPWAEGQGDYVLINESDFNADEYELFELAGKIIAAVGGNGGAPNTDGDPLNTARTRYLEVFGKRPFHGWDLETLNAKIAEASQEETATNDLTRREITGDLEAMQVEFDPNDGIEDLAALRDLAREERNK